MKQYVDKLKAEIRMDLPTGCETDFKISIATDDIDNFAKLSLDELHSVIMNEITNATFEVVFTNVKTEKLEASQWMN